MYRTSRIGVILLPTEECMIKQHKRPPPSSRIESISLISHLVLQLEDLLEFYFPFRDEYNTLYLLWKTSIYRFTGWAPTKPKRPGPTTSVFRTVNTHTFNTMAAASLEKASLPSSLELGKRPGIRVRLLLILLPPFSLLHCFAYHKRGIPDSCLAAPLTTTTSTQLRQTGAHAIPGSFRHKLIYNALALSSPALAPAAASCGCRLDVLELGTRWVTMDGYRKAVVLPQPDLAVFYHAAHTSASQARAAREDAAALRELGVPVLEVVDVAGDEHQNAEMLEVVEVARKGERMDVVAWQTWRDFDARRCDMHIRYVIRPYAERAKREAWGCRNQWAVYEKSWWEGLEKGGGMAPQRRRRRFAALPRHAKIIVGLLLLFFWVEMGRRISGLTDWRFMH